MSRTNNVSEDLTASKSMEKESFNKLTAVREMKATQIQDYFRMINNQIITYSEDWMIVDAMRAFREGFETVPS